MWWCRFVIDTVRDDRFGFGFDSLFLSAFGQNGTGFDGSSSAFVQHVFNAGHAFATLEHDLSESETCLANVERD